MEDLQLIRWVFLGISAYIIVGGSIFLIVLIEKVKIVIKILEEINKHQIQSAPNSPTLKALNDIYEAGRK